MSNVAPEFVEAHRKIALGLNPLLQTPAARPNTIEGWAEELAQVEKTLAELPEVSYEPIVWEDGTQSLTAEELKEFRYVPGKYVVMDECL